MFVATSVSSILQLPVTRVWAAVISRGVPLGAQIAWLSMSTRGWPPLVTRSAPVTHWAVRHGTGEPLTLNGHPATTQGAATVTVGWPLTSTRGFGAVAWP